MNNELRRAASGADKRRNKRVLLRALFPMDSTINFSAGTLMKQSGVLHSLSDHGAFVKGSCVPAVGEELEMSFRFGSRQIHCFGKVIYSIRHQDALVTPGFGIKFTRILASDFRAIHSCIQEFEGDMEKAGSEIRLDF